MAPVFRRPGEPQVPTPWRQKCVWLHLGIRNDEAARRFAEAGIKVAQHRCLLVEQGRLR